MRVHAFLCLIPSLFLLPRSAGASQRRPTPMPPVTGQVKSVDASAQTFVVAVRLAGSRSNQDVTVRIDGTTKFTKSQGDGSFADLLPGRFVTIRGDGDARAGITAHEIQVLDRGPGRGQGASGTVQSVDANAGTFVLMTRPTGTREDIPVTIRVDDKTAYFAGRRSAHFADLTVGKRVLVQGEGDPRKELTAREIRILPAARRR